MGMPLEKHGGKTPSWWDTTVPPTQVTNSSNTWVGIKVQFTVPGRIFGIRAFVKAGGFETHIGTVIDQDAMLMKTAKNFASVTLPSNGWLQCWIHPTIRVVVGHVYQIAVSYPLVNYFRSTVSVGAGITNNGITLFNSFQSAVWDLTNTAPTYNLNRNGVDVLFRAD